MDSGRAVYAERPEAHRLKPSMRRSCLPEREVQNRSRKAREKQEVKHILTALVSLAAITSATCRVYDVDENMRMNGWSAKWGFVGQSFVCTADSLLWAEYFVGEANSGGQYQFQIQTYPEGEIVLDGDANAGDSVHHKFVRASLTPRLGAQELIKGKEYMLKVTHTSGDSINWYADTTNPYQLGRMLGGDASLRRDLCARIEGVNRPVDDSFFALHTWTWPFWRSRATLEHLDTVVHSVGVNWCREGIGWDWLHSSESTFDWRASDSILLAQARARNRVLLYFEGLPTWTSTHVDSIRNGRTYWSSICPPRNLDQTVMLDESTPNPSNHLGYFIYNLVERYCPGSAFWSDHGLLDASGVDCYEVFNEPNYWQDADTGFRYPTSGDPVVQIAVTESLYARACDVVCEAARAAYARTRVFAGVVGGVEYSDTPPKRLVRGKDWLRGYYRYRRDSRIAGITAHLYQFGDTAEALNPTVFARDLDTIRSIMRDGGDEGRELWISELGWRGNSDFRTAALSVLEAYVTSTGTSPAAFADRVFWFFLYDLASLPNQPSTIPALLGLKDDGFPARPSYCAYQQMTQQLPDKRMNGRVLLGDSATDAKSRVYELEDPADGKRTWVGWRNYEPGAKSVMVRIPARTDQLDIAPLARDANADRLNRRVAAGSDGWLWPSLDTIPVYVHEVGSPKRPDLTVDSVWTEPVGENQVTLHAKVRNTGNRQFAPASRRKGCVLRFIANDLTILPASEPRSIPPGGFALIRSLPFTPEPGVSYLVSARANPDRDVMELGFDNNTGYCPLSVR